MGDYWDTSDGDYYYLLVSAYDDAGYFNQIGLTAFEGYWYVTWDSVDCNNGGPFDATADLLGAYSSYYFAMEIDSGVVTFSVSTGSGTEFWSHSESGRGDVFLLENPTSTACGSKDGFTVWEEMFRVHDQKVPTANFQFRYLEVDETPVDHEDWDTPYEDDRQSTPSTPNEPLPLVLFGDASGLQDGMITIYNQWFWLRCTTDCYNLRGPPGVDFDDVHLQVHSHPSEWATNCETTCDVSLNVLDRPSDWTIDLSTESDTPPFELYVDIDTPSSADEGGYEFGIQVEQGSGYRHTVWMHVSLGDDWSVDNDGGCVVAGTLVETSSGQVDVSSLNIQDAVSSWDVSTEGISMSEVVQGTWQFVGETLEVQGLAINDNAIIMPARGQSIYRVSFDGSDWIEGWIDDARDLNPGDFIFNGHEQQWDLVESVGIVGSIEMLCNLGTSGPNNFVANGYLVGGYVAS
jgi:hypothetical protein